MRAIPSRLVTRTRPVRFWSYGLLSCAIGVVWSCGDDGARVPGYSSPCNTPMAPHLACATGRAQAADSPIFSDTDACAKLVRCGILADEFFVNAGDDHRLDFGWCAERLSRIGRPTDPCSGHPYTASQVDAAVRCIQALPCAGLGLELNQKIGSGDRPDLDQYECADGNKRRTATVCDHGLLSY